LWSPSNWLKTESSLPSNNEVIRSPVALENPILMSVFVNFQILQWLLSLTTKVLCEGRLNVSTSDAKNMFSPNGRRTFTEYIIIANFLMRARLNRIRQALDWIHSIL
jgi:PTEN induced putative kinase 1